MLVAAALAVLLLVAYVVTSPTRPGVPAPTPSATADPSLPHFPDPTPPAGMPRPDRGTTTRPLGSLRGRSVITSGAGTVVLRYARAPHDATRVHFICTGCDAGTWLVELPRGYPVATYGPLADPADATGVTDTVDPGARTDLLVHAASGARWTVTLTPFDQIPVHRESFVALDADVVAVRTTADLRLTCGNAFSYRTFARERRGGEYDAVELGGDNQGGTAVLHAPTGTDPLVLDVRCPGRWSVAVA